MTSANSNDPDVVEALGRIEEQLETLKFLRGKSPDPIEPGKERALDDQQHMSQRMRGVDPDYFKTGKRFKTEELFKRTKNVDLYELRKIVEGQIRNVVLP